MQTNIVADFLGLEYTGLKQTHTNISKDLFLWFAFLVDIPELKNEEGKTTLPPPCGWILFWDGLFPRRV